MTVSGSNLLDGFMQTSDNLQIGVVHVINL